MGTSVTSARGTAASASTSSTPSRPTTWCPRTPSGTSSELKKVLKAGSGDLILATDYDREGEAIAYHVASLLGVDPTTAKRVTFTEITRDAILEAFGQPRAIDLQLFDAQEARRILDRLVGYPHLAPALEAGPPRPVGRPRAVGRRAADRRARARDPRVRAGRVLERRRSSHARGPRAAVHRPAHPGARGQARGLARQEGRAARRRGRGGRRTSSACAAPPTASRTSRRRSASARRRRRSRPRPCSRKPRASSGSAPARR